MTEKVAEAPIREPERVVAPPILEAMLTKLSGELNKPEINRLEFVQNDKDFDNRRYSLKEPGAAGGCVAKVGINELEDAPTTASVRRQLEDRLRTAFRSHYGTKK